ncbi:MYG1 family protein [Tritonibacter mobilis]|uniref:Metal-dependent hydrolase n=1 Tax=Tritonibacter mobilis F1926 TaxID=1265309 RepID=A0A1B0ZZG8_9RHOB|nr:MYG1 family protein [Tritonibacter mobilis]ANP39627.1 metal-dependent hydrolase [Tritonibacter mobilis F1926]KJZ21707.1 metal-dependent hydrolase [Tritonibacter mobilis]
MTISHLVTHSGGFHADELLSTVILSRLYPDAELVRTRDKSWITPAEGRIIYDVGGEFDAGAGIFDHHQRPNPLRPNGQPYSSFGLIWAEFGRDYLRAQAVPEKDLEQVHAAFDEDFVRPVDLLDNGAVDTAEAGSLFAGLTLPVLLESLKPVFDDRSEGADDTAFHAALTVARAIVEARIRHKAAKLRAADVVLTAIKDAGTGRVLELPMGMPFRGAVERAGADHLLFVVHPRNSDWALTTIRTGDDTFETRADLPAAWAGLTDAALEQASGVKGAKFCHNARFLAIADSRDAILKLAELAVAEVAE